MSKKLTKEEVKKPDFFIHYTDVVIAWIEKHGKLVATTLAFFILAGTGYVAVKKFQNYQEQKAQDELYDLRVSLEKLRESFQAKDAVEKNPKVKLAQEVVETKKDFTTHYESVINKYKDFIDQNNNTNAQSAAYIQLGSLYAENEKFEEAESLITPPLSKLNKESFYYGLMAMLLSQTLMNQGKYTEAIPVLESVSNQDNQKHLHAESLFRLGLCYDHLKESEKAKQYFERVTRDFEKSDAANHAKNYLRYLSLKENA